MSEQEDDFWDVWKFVIWLWIVIALIFFGAGLFFAVELYMELG